MPGISLIIIGTIVHTPTLGQLEILRDHLIAIDADGFVHALVDHHSTQAKAILAECQALDPPVEPLQMPSGSFITPTFVDLHLHAPQFMYLGTGLHLPLMEWLDQYAYKAEERLDADPALATKVYSKLCDRLIETGTGAMLAFGTIKEETNLILAQVAQSKGIRAFVGKLSMDISSRPSYIEASAESAMDSIKSFIHRCRTSVSHLPAPARLVEPVITPRFVPTCSDELLKGLGSIATIENVAIQSHLAEARDQVDWVRSLRNAEDIQVFERSGLLTSKTIQAHCTFLEAPELTRLQELGTSVAHCPLSNAYFSSRPFPLREALDTKVKVGLGTDVAGGYQIDIMNTMRAAVSTSRMREGARSEAAIQGASQITRNLSIDWKESLFLATRGGAEALGLGSGLFAVGSPFDAQLVNLFDENGAGIGGLDFFDLDSTTAGEFRFDEVTVEKWWCLGDFRNRARMWIQGKQLK